MRRVEFVSPGGVAFSTHIRPDVDPEAIALLGHVADLAALWWQRTKLVRALDALVLRRRSEG